MKCLRRANRFPAVFPRRFLSRLLWYAACKYSSGQGTKNIKGDGRMEVVNIDCHESSKMSICQTLIHFPVCRFCLSWVPSVKCSMTLRLLRRLFRQKIEKLTEQMLPWRGIYHCNRPDLLAVCFPFSKWITLFTAIFVCEWLRVVRYLFFTPNKHFCCRKGTAHPLSLSPSLCEGCVHKCPTAIISCVTHHQRVTPFLTRTAHTHTDTPWSVDKRVDICMRSKARSWVV